MVWHCFCDPTFSRLGRTLTCDRQTDTSHSIYRARIVLRGKNGLKSSLESHVKMDEYTMEAQGRNTTKRLFVLKYYKLKKTTSKCYNQDMQYTIV